jgi:hypothetical protein
MAPGNTTPPKLARAVFLHVGSALGRKYNSVIGWAKRQGWTDREAVEALSWLERQRLLESFDGDYLRAVRGANAPQGEDKPAPSSIEGLKKVAAKDEQPAPAIDHPEEEVDSDDDTPVDRDEEDGEEPEEDEEALSTSSPPPVAEESPKPPRTRRPAPRELPPAELTSREGEPPPKWLPELILFLGKVRSRYELGQWALPRAIPTHRLMEQLDALESAGRLKISGTRSNRYYQLDGAPLVRNPPRRVDAPAAPAPSPPSSPPPPPKPAPPALPVAPPEASAPAAPSLALPPVPAPVPAPEVAMPVRSKTPKLAPAAPTLPPPALAAAPPPRPSDVKIAFARLPSAERAKARQSLERIDTLATRLEELRVEASTIEAEIESLVRGEVEAPAVPTTPSEARKANARGKAVKDKAPASEKRPTRQGRPGVAKDGQGPSMGVRALELLSGGATLSTKDIQGQLGAENYSSVSTVLTRLTASGDIVRVGKGLYRLAAKPAKKAGGR